MDIIQAHNYFSLLMDKVGSPYFTSSEIDIFIQRGQMDYVNQFFNKSIGLYNAEENSYDVERLYSIIEKVNVQADVDGMVMYEDINNELSTGEFMYVLSLEQQKSSDSSCNENSNTFAYSQFVRHNDKGPRLKYSFKRPTDNNPIHIYYSTYIEVLPQVAKNVGITVVRTPALVTIDDPNDTGSPGPGLVDFDLPEISRDSILMFALKNAGINIRDKEFYALINNQAETST